MGSEQEAYRAGKEARAETGAHPERPSRHEEALSRYLGGAAYRERHMSRPKRSIPETPTDQAPPNAGVGPATIGGGPVNARTSGAEPLPDQLPRHRNWVRRLFSRH